MKADGFKYYEYVLVYIDNILAVSGNPKAIMDYLESKYMLKKDSIKEPDSYLGTKIFKWCINGVKDEEKLQWVMLAEGYLKLVLKDVEATLDEVGKKLPSKASTPFIQLDYKLELDNTPKIDPSHAMYFQGLIGILRWCIELRHMDIIMEVTKLSNFLVSPREGHLEQAFHILAYLKKHLHSSLVFDDTEPNLSGFHFTKMQLGSAVSGSKRTNLK